MVREEKTAREIGVAAFTSPYFDRHELETIIGASQIWHIFIEIFQVQ
jgi:hypothetical protein